MNNRFTSRLAIVLAVSALFSGCAPMVSGVMNATLDPASLKDKTAQYFGVPSDQIVIASIEKNALTTTYQATKKDGKVFNCTVYYGAVDCKQPGGQSDQSVAPHAAVQPSPVAATPSIAQTAGTAPMSAVQAQGQLNKFGYPVGRPDGVLGKKTVEQLKAFQKSRGIPATGALDEPTVAALR